MMMTEVQIEAAARKLCELRGINPEKEILHSPEPNKDGSALAVMVTSPAWKLAIPEIRDFINLHNATNIKDRRSHERSNS